MSARETIDTEMMDLYRKKVEPVKRLQKKQSRKLLLFFVICILIGVAIGVGMVVYEQTTGKKLPLNKISDTPGLLLLLFLWYLATTILQIVIHEAGHLIAGLMSGYHFVSFRIFSFTIIKQDGKIRRKKLKVPGTAGQCLMSPPEWKEEGFPVVFYNLGGGLLNLLISLPLLPFAIYGEKPLAWFIGIFIFSGVILGLSNLIPMTVGLSNDGKNCISCLKSKSITKSFYLQLKLNAELSTGKDYNDYSEEMLDYLSETDLTNLINGCLVFFKQSIQYSKSEFEKAEQLLSVLNEKQNKLPLAMMNGIATESLFLLCRKKKQMLNPTEQEQKELLADIASSYTLVAPVLKANKRDLGMLRVYYTYLVCMSETEREQVDWLVASKKGKLPTKLPKRKPVSAEKVYEDIEKIFPLHPVAGEARLQQNLVQMIRQLVTEQQPAE